MFTFSIGSVIDIIQTQYFAGSRSEDEAVSENMPCRRLAVPDVRRPCAEGREACRGVAL